MSLTPATQALLAWPYRMLRTDLGRRTVAAVLVSVALATTVQTLYANADTPSAPAAAVDRVVPAGAAGTGARAASQAQATTAATPASGASAPTAAAAPTKPGGSAGTPAGARGKADGDEPGKVAAAWYARKRGVQVGRVKLLQQRRKNADEVRVLVMVEIGDRLDTAEVVVRRTKSGWKVP